MGARFEERHMTVDLQHLESREEIKMAFVGFLNPYIASLVDEEKKIYKDLFMCGEAMRVNVTPNYNEAKLYCNNRMKEYVKEFKDGSITLGTDHLPVEASKVCFGHDVIDNDSEIVYKTNDMANYVGVGFFADEMLNGRKRYVATVLYKVKFGEAADEYSTKGENIEFKTPSIDGVIAGIKNNEWKRVKIFDTEADADKWLRGILGGSTSDGTASTAAYKTVQIDK